MRKVYLDNLKVVLIATIIALHAILGYGGLVEGWTYSGVREATLHPAVEILLLVLISPVGFFFMTLLFLVAGLLTPGSFERKGAGRFAGDRLLRLGVPFAVYVLAIQPTMVYLLEHRYGDTTGSYWQEYLGDERQIDTGPLWFVGVLLVFSLAYAAWRRLRGDRPVAVRPVTLRSLVVAAVLVAPASFAIRIVYPYGGEAGATDLNWWQWPACIALFVLGIRASYLGWLDAVPDDLVRVARRLTLVGLPLMTVVLTEAGFADRLDDALGGWHWRSAAFATVEAVLTVFGSVWVLQLAQRHLDRPLPHGEALGRSAYAAFILQTVFLLALAVAIRPLPMPAEAKAVLVGALGIVCSFGTAWLLVDRVPGVRGPVTLSRRR